MRTRMNYLTTCTLVSIIFLFFTSSVYAEGISDEAYKLLYENQKENNSQILSTIYWSLGGMLTVILLFIGSNVFFNIRSQKNNAEKLTNEFNAKLLQITSELTNSAEIKLNDLLEKSSVSINDGLTNIKQENISNFNLLNEAIESKLVKLNNEIDSNYKSNKSSINNLTKKVNVKTLKLTADIHNNQAKIWELQGVNRNAVTEYVREGEILKTLDAGLGICIENIIRNLEKTKIIMSIDRKQIMDFLNNLPAEYSVENEKIISILKTIKYN